jgi:hypothetical protein
MRLSPPSASSRASAPIDIKGSSSLPGSPKFSPDDSSPEDGGAQKEVIPPASAPMPGRLRHADNASGLWGTGSRMARTSKGGRASGAQPLPLRRGSGFKKCSPPAALDSAVDYASHELFMQQPGCWSIESSLMASPASSFNKKGGSMLHHGASNPARDPLPSSRRGRAVDESLDSHVRQLACWSLESSLMASPTIGSTAGLAQHRTVLPMASPILHSVPGTSVLAHLRQLDAREDTLSPLRSPKRSPLLSPSFPPPPRSKEGASGMWDRRMERRSRGASLPGDAGASR